MFLKKRNILILVRKQQQKIADLLIEMKMVISASLPIGHSFIPYDILLAVIKGDEFGNDLTVKALFASLPHSDMGIRYHFKRLIESGWIHLHNGDKDTRIKRVAATDKLTKRFELVLTKILPIIADINFDVKD